MTEGKPVVSKLIWNTQAMTPGTGATAGNALSGIFYSLEKLSEHPLAEAGQIIACDYVGIVSGNKVPDKFARAGFHATRSEFVLSLIHI